MTPPPLQPPQPVAVFLCCAQVDARFRKALEKHLAPLIERKILSLWHPGKLPPGADVDRETLAELDRAHIVLAITTADLLDSPPLLSQIERANARGTTAVAVVPVLVRECQWRASPLGAWSPVPETGASVASLKDKDAAWSQIVRAVLIHAVGAEAASNVLGHAPPERQPPRERWLRAMVDAAADRCLLAGIGSGLGVQLGDVRVPARVALDRDGNHPLSPLADQIVTASARSRFVLAGDVGTGKSEMLYETCGRLAERALRDPTAPIPLLVRARDLAKGLRKALLAMWPTCDDIIPGLLSTRPRFILLVDGLDEAGREAPEDVQKLASAQGSRCHALVVASRPILRFRDLRAEERWLVRWSPDESDRFLARCAEHLPRAAERLRAARAFVAPGLLDNPLTASMCLLVAEREPEALAGRVALFRAVVRRLLDDWLVQRKSRSSHVEKVMSVLEALALGVVRGHLKSISESRLLKALGRDFPGRESIGVETAEAHVGLLVRRADGAFDFALRSLAEHLAGRALLLKGEAAIVTASRAAWGAEPVRHAIGLAAIEGSHTSPPDPGHASTLIDALLCGEDEDDITSSNRHLRSVLAAARAATDLDRIRRSTLKCLMAAVVRRLWDETSMWVGERVADVVASWVRARPGHVKDLVIVALQSILQPASRAS